MKFPIDQIKSKKLHLRRLDFADRGAIFSIFSNPEVTRFWSSPKMTDLSEADKFIKVTHNGFKDDSLLEWGIIESKTDRLIGTCAWSGWDKAHKHAEIGFALHREYWGRGLMKEILSEFIPFGFHELELHRIEANVDPRNKASIKLMEYFGFQKEGYLRERYHLNGEIQDSLFYALLSKEWLGPE